MRLGIRVLLRSVVLSLAVGGCAEEAALSVGDVPFSRAQLLGLSETQTDLLAMIASVGLASARGEAAEVGSPILERRREDVLIERLRQEVALEQAGVGDQALDARYSLNPQFELTVRHLVILSERWRPEAMRAEARSRAEAALTRARAGEPFPELAGEVSEEPGAEARGGLLTPGREGTWVDEFWQAASALEVGEISDVVETEYGFHVLRLDGRDPIPFSEARPRVVAEVAAQVESPGAWERQISTWAQSAGADLADPSDLGDERVRSMLLGEVERRGLTITAPQEAGIQRDWELRFSAWAAAFGFEAGMMPEEVAEQAILALGRTDQNARIAREELPGFREALLGAYPVTLPNP